MDCEHGFGLNNEIFLSSNLTLTFHGLLHFLKLILSTPSLQYEK